MLSYHIFLEFCNFSINIIIFQCGANGNYAKMPENRWMEHRA